MSGAGESGADTNDHSSQQGLCFVALVSPDAPMASVADTICGHHCESEEFLKTARRESVSLEHERIGNACPSFSGRNKLQRWGDKEPSGCRDTFPESLCYSVTILWMSVVPDGAAAHCRDFARAAVACDVHLHPSDRCRHKDFHRLIFLNRL